MTTPDLTPDEQGTDEAGRRARLVEGALITLILLMAGVLGAPALLDSVRNGTIDLGAVFYPVMLGAAVALAWTRRTGQ